jgi:hypothetical protein
MSFRLSARLDTSDGRKHKNLSLTNRRGSLVGAPGSEPGTSRHAPGASRVDSDVDEPCGLRSPSASGLTPLKWIPSNA